MADEYIKRSDVQDALHSAIIEWNKDCGIARMEYLRIRLNNVPAADVRPMVRGRWLKHGYCCPCSACGWDSGFSGTPLELKISEFNFCPNCGADMREVQHDD